MAKPLPVEVDTKKVPEVPNRQSPRQFGPISLIIAVFFPSFIHLHPPSMVVFWALYGFLTTCFSSLVHHSPYVQPIRSSPFGYGSIPINTIFSGMNIHLPAILMFTRGTWFWHTAIWVFHGPCLNNVAVADITRLRHHVWPWPMRRHQQSAFHLAAQVPQISRSAE